MLRIALDGAVAAPLAIAIALAAATPTPLLQTRGVGLAGRVDPAQTGRRLGVERGERPECVRLRLPSGRVTAPLCNTRMHCAGGAVTAPTLLEVHRLAEGGGLYVSAGSECDSGCCDSRGTVVTYAGQRLDDGPLARVYLRLGRAGLVAVAWWALCVAYSVLIARRARLARLGALFGVAAAVAALWVNR